MPPLPLTSLLYTALPKLSRTNRAILSTLGCLNGKAPAADEIAAWVGLRDRHQLSRSLHRDGLPPIERLAAWTRVLYWLLEAETSHSSLLQLARREGIDPAAAYRLVQRVTGQRWSGARRAGLTVALLRFREQCRGPLVGARRRLGATQGEVVAVAVGDDYTIMRPPLSLQASRQATRGHPVGVLAGRIPMSGYPCQVVIAPDGTAYVARAHAAALECVSLAPLRSIGTIPTGAAPTSVALNASGRNAYVVNQFSEDIAVVDLMARARTDSIAVPGHPLAGTLSPDGRTLFVVTNLDRLCAVNLAARRVTSTLALTHAGHAAATHPSGRWVYVPTWRAGTLVEVDAHTLLVAREFTLGGITQETVVSADGLTLYVANQGGWLDVIHHRTGRQVARINFRAPAVHLAASPDGAVLYAGLHFSGRVAVIDRETLRVTGMLEPGGKPRAIAFDPTGRHAVVGNEEGWLDLVR